MEEKKPLFSFRGLTKSILIVVVSLSLAVPSVAFAEPTAAEKQEEAQAALDSLNQMQDNLNKASDNYFTAVAEQEEALANMADAQERIDTTSDEIETVQEKLGSRANTMYRSGNTTVIDLLLGANSFEEFATNWDILNRMNQEDADTVQLSKDLRTQIEEEKQEYADQEAIAAAKAEEARKIKEEAEATVDAMQDVYDNLSAEAAELLEQERAAQEAAEAAAAQAVLDAAANEAANNGGGVSNGGDNGSGGYFNPSYDAVTGNAIVDRAYGCLGAPYAWGACGPSSFDCSGLVGYAVSGSYSRMGTTYTFLGWTRVSDPQPGDIAVNEGHCGIYIGNGQMIHAATYGVGVIVGPVQGGMVFVRP